MAHTRRRNKRKRPHGRPFNRSAQASFSSWEVAALHEAAHAVLADHIGMPIDAVTLSIEPRDDTACTVAGSTCYPTVQWNESDTPAVMRGMTLIAMVGHALENVLGVPNNWGGRPARPRGRTGPAQEYNSPGEVTVWGRIGSTDTSHAHAHLDELASFHGVAWTLAERDVLVAAATTRAEAFVREHIDMIEAVGTALLQKAQRLLLAPHGPRPTHWRVSIEGDELRALLDHPIETTASTPRLVAASSA